ncbi:molybdopterin-dependent oxidoreductase [Propionibacteriaceae bacterium Y2011]
MAVTEARVPEASTPTPEPATPGPATAPRRPRLFAALSGVVATAAGLAAAALVAQVVAPSSSPVVAIGDWLIAVLPGPVVNFGKDTLGHADKPVLLAVITLVALALGALAGLLEYDRERLAWAVIGPVAVFAARCALLGPDMWLVALVPAAVAVGISFALLSALLNRLDDATAEPSPQSRRNFVQWLVGGGIAAALGFAADRVVTGTVGRPGGGPPGPPLPTPADPVTIPTTTDLQLSGLSPYVTPNNTFYRIDTALVVPRINHLDWQLRIYGMVQREVVIDYATLSGRQLVEHVATLSCVSNTVGGDLVGNARWLGLPLRELLAEAGPLPGADMVLSRSKDGFTAGTPLEAMTDPERQSLLAIGMNGEPLPLEHGFPARLVVPGLYGYVSATKWVTELKVTTFAADQGYWTPLGWSALGPVKLASRIDVPRGRADAGTVQVAGVAWAQHTGIAAVEVQVDGGAWQPARLADTTGPDTWRQWVFEWQATPGDHELRCRARDSDGEWQTEQEVPPAPDGATGLHTRTISIG